MASAAGRPTEAQGVGMEEEKDVITAADAESLLADGAEQIHNFVNPRANLLIGCDYDRADAIAALKSAEMIELAGPDARAMKHPIAVWSGTSLSYFEADMDKLAAWEAKRK